MYDAKLFHFDSTPSLRGVVAVVPESVSSKQELFEALAKALSFPEYFGENWDALIDCLSDLSWIDATEVTVLHRGLPALPERELRTYLECLQDVRVRTEGRDSPMICFVFPPTAAGEIQRLLA